MTIATPLSSFTVPFSDVTLRDFFTRLGTLPDEQVSVVGESIAFERVVTATGKHSFIGQLMDGLDQTMAACTSPIKQNFVRAAINAGIVKAVGYAGGDLDADNRPRHDLDRDFPAALALVRRYEAAASGRAELCTHARSLLADLRVRQENLHLV